MSAAVLDSVRRNPQLSLPAYLTDHAALATQVAAIRQALPAQVELLYAARANPDPVVLQTLRPHIDGFKVASGGELRHVGTAFPGALLSFGGPGKTDAELALAVASGVHRIQVESERELEVLAELATGTQSIAGLAQETRTIVVRQPVDVLLRVNTPRNVPGAPLSRGGRPSPFGPDPSRLDEAAAFVARSPGLRFRGLHLHLASGFDAQADADLTAQAVDWVRNWAARTGHPVEELSLGGGMAVDHAGPAARFDWTAYAARLSLLARQNPLLLLKIEPGRSLTA